MAEFQPSGLPGVAPVAKYLYPKRLSDLSGPLLGYQANVHLPNHPNPEIHAHRSYAKDAPLPEGSQATIPCKFAHVAVNKNRSAINAVEFLPHGRRLLTASQAGEFTLWNAQSFSYENLMQAHSAAVRALCFTPDQSTLISGDSSGTVRLWDANFFPFASFGAHKEQVRDIAVAPSSAKFVTCADESAAKIFDFRTGAEERLLQGHGWDVRCVDWHPDKALIATGSKDCNIKLWDPRVEGAVCTIYAHKSVVGKVKWSKDGQYLISGSRDLTVKGFDIRKMSCENRIFKGHLKEVTCLAWSPVDPGLFVSGSYDGNLIFWDIHRSEKPVENLIGAHDASIWSISFHPLGHLLATGSHDNCTKFWSRPAPGDRNPQESAPKGRMYQQYMEMLKEKDNLGNLPADNIYRPPLAVRSAPGI